MLPTTFITLIKVISAGDREDLTFKTFNTVEEVGEEDGRMLLENLAMIHRSCISAEVNAMMMVSFVISFLCVAKVSE